MIKNGPARTFTRNAVEAWLFRLSDCDWEKFIDKQHLKIGRSFYREGVLSSLDIQSTQIIVTQKIDRVETYSVIEWNEKKPEIRTSSLDDSIGIALGTAGLYEIEELVAEIHQEDPLLEQICQSEIEKQDLSVNEPEPQPTESKEKGSGSGVIPITILIEISSSNGLAATPFWQISKRDKRKAYGQNDETEIENTDRPTLMNFVAESGRH